MQDALIDVRLFARRAVGSSAGTTFLFGTAFFGTMFLLPLYYQVVRGQSAFDSGLLLAPQGIGAMLMMPIAGKLTDKMGAGKIVLSGLTLVALGMFGLAQTSDTTSFWQISATLFVLGMGIGSTMMPAMSSALRTLRREEVARATSGLNVVQRVGGSIGTALLAVVLANQLSDKLAGSGVVGGGERGLSAASELSPAALANIAPALADAFAHTFYWSFGIILLAFIPAYFLPRSVPKIHGSKDEPVAPLIME